MLNERSRTMQYHIMHIHYMQKRFLKLEFHIVIITTNSSFMSCLMLLLSNRICMRLLFQLIVSFMYQQIILYGHKTNALALTKGIVHLFMWGLNYFCFK